MGVCTAMKTTSASFMPSARLVVKLQAFLLDVLQDQAVQARLVEGDDALAQAGDAFLVDVDAGRPRGRSRPCRRPRPGPRSRCRPCRCESWNLLSGLVQQAQQGSSDVPGRAAQPVAVRSLVLSPTRWGVSDGRHRAGSCADRDRADARRPTSISSPSRDRQRRSRADVVDLARLALPSASSR